MKLEEIIKNQNNVTYFNVIGQYRDEQLPRGRHSNG